MPADPLFPDPSREFLEDSPEEPVRDVVPRHSKSDVSADANGSAVQVRRDDSGLAVHDEPIRHATATNVPTRRGLSFLGIAAAVAVGLVVAMLALGLVVKNGLSAMNPFKESTVDRSGPSVVQAIQDLKSFTAASGYYEVVVDQEKTVTNLPSIISGDRILFVAAGTVDATVDFSGLDAGAITTNADRTAATIRLPAPTVGKATLDLDRSYVADHQRGLKERVQDALGKSTTSDVDTAAIYKVAEQKLTAAGQANNELRSRAEANTKAMLTSLLGSLGYTSVTVVFEPQP